MGVLQRQKEDIESQIAGVKLRLKFDNQTFKQAKETEKMISSGNRAAAIKAMKSVRVHIEEARKIAGDITISARNKKVDLGKVGMKGEDEAELRKQLQTVVKMSDNIDLKARLHQAPDLDAKLGMDNQDSVSGGDTSLPGAETASMVSEEHPSEVATPGAGGGEASTEIENQPSERTTALGSEE